MRASTYGDATSSSSTSPRATYLQSASISDCICPARSYKTDRGMPRLLVPRSAPRVPSSPWRAKSCLVSITLPSWPGSIAGECSVAVGGLNTWQFPGWMQRPAFHGMRNSAHLFTGLSLPRRTCRRERVVAYLQLRSEDRPDATFVTI
ncbi:hypothetical protein DENSPDRAFT_60602 [Dentipellis sp. KUC8613]|nr:hypothetical protein DENSPDRAFT_60602 [Dentipellis sp. KUC8613]